MPCFYVIIEIGFCALFLCDLKKKSYKLPFCVLVLCDSILPLLLLVHIDAEAINAQNKIGPFFVLDVKIADAIGLKVLCHLGNNFDCCNFLFFEEQQIDTIPKLAKCW